MLRGRAHGPSQVSPALVMMVAALVCGTAGELLGAQAERKMSEGSSSSARIEQGVDLAAKGKCPEALAILRKSIPAPVDKQLRYRAAMASAQCGMSVDQADVVVESLLLLNREFPDDSKVLYITSRYYSELANRAARKLTVKAPSSAEAQVLMAEAYQARGVLEMRQRNTAGFWSSTQSSPVFITNSAKSFSPKCRPLPRKPRENSRPSCKSMQTHPQQSTCLEILLRGR